MIHEHDVKFKFHCLQIVFGARPCVSVCVLPTAAFEDGSRGEQL